MNIDCRKAINIHTCVGVDVSRDCDAKCHGMTSIPLSITLCIREYLSMNIDRKATAICLYTYKCCLFQFVLVYVCLLEPNRPTFYYKQTTTKQQAFAICQQPLSVRENCALTQSKRKCATAATRCVASRRDGNAGTGRQKKSANAAKASHV